MPDPRPLDTDGLPQDAAVRARALEAARELHRGQEYDTDDLLAVARWILAAGEITQDDFVLAPPPALNLPGDVFVAVRDGKAGETRSLVPGVVGYFDDDGAVIGVLVEGATGVQND